MKFNQRILIFLVFVIVVVIGAFFVLTETRQEIITIIPKPKKPASPVLQGQFVEEKLPSAETEIGDSRNIEVPELIKGLYLTSWSVSTPGHLRYILELASSTEVNTLVIDIKDFSGYVAYDTNLAEVERYGAEQIRLKDIAGLIEDLHSKGIYLIARIVVFQDPVLAKARQDLAIQSKAKLASLSEDFLWLDDVDLPWIDPAAREAWQYNVAIAKETSKLGFDEINFDYIRFPSDGDLEDMAFPFWDEITAKHTVIKEFFKFIRQALPGIKISIDLFGQTTVDSGDMGVGQFLEDAFDYFDFVCPMVYPSHYAPGFLGFAEPAEHPYEVVKNALESALRRLEIYNQGGEVPSKTQLRPWLQDFDLRGVPYGSEEVRAEIQAVRDALGDNFNGFLLWNSWNYYTREALEVATK